MDATNRRSLRTFALLIASSSLLLTSCSFGVVDTAKTPSPSSTVESPDAAESPEPTDDVDTPNAPEPDETPDSDEDPEVEGELNRSAWEALTTNELDCASGEELISQTGQVITITADCDRVTVTAVGAVVLTQGVGELEVSGTGTTVILTEVENVTITGTGISVGWETGSPSVTNTGTGSSARILKEDER